MKLSDQIKPISCLKAHAVGLREYREMYFKPYRIIYRISSQSVYVMVIADGRRDMQSLLERRLFQT